MSPFQRYRWFVAAAAITAVFAVVCLFGHKSFALTAFADLAGLVLMLATTGILLANAKATSGQERSFWVLMSFGLLLWISNQMAWTYREVLLRRPIPDPYFFDIILFFHSVPLIAAAAWRPDELKKEGRVHLPLLNFLMLLGWWIFLYAFIVFPHQYVTPNVDRYNVYYDRLYGVENLLLLAVLGFVALTSSGGWRRLYLHLLGAGVVYGINSQLLDRASANDTYYSGSPYDIALIGTVAWFGAAALSARQWNLKSVEPARSPRWTRILPQLAMLAILSLPALGLWEVLDDTSPAASRTFRVSAVLGGMLLLGTFVFLRQYLQDQALMALLQDSRRGYEGQKSLQDQLVQKEKLASLGTLVAGAAGEINHPLTSIMTYSENLWTQEGLTAEQSSLVRKIVTQAQRTRDLVTNLLSFAQQAPGEKALVDLSLLLNRATQMLEPRYTGGNIRVATSIAKDLPRVQGNVNQLFQVFIEIIENAMDALQENGGGSLEVAAHHEAGEVVLQFSDNGPGIREPQRVFDPFYTTKPVGKGTGLGLSVVYGVIQDHGGQISCQNKPEGGAVFVVKFPVAADAVALVAGAGGD